jgi:hypothetical protein
MDALVLPHARRQTQVAGTYLETDGGDLVRDYRFRQGFVNSACLAFLIALLHLAAAQPPFAHAQGSRPQSAYAVTGVAADDVLNVRDAPGGNQIIGSVPPNARGLVALGPRGKSGGGTWLQIRYGSTIGWVNQRFLKPDTTRISTAAISEQQPASDITKFQGAWAHDDWALEIDSEHIMLAPLGGTAPGVHLMLGSRNCGVIYEQTHALLPAAEVATTFTDPRFEAWVQSAARARFVDIMIVTCGALSHRFVFMIAEPQKMLVAEWDNASWRMLEEFRSRTRQVGTR